MKKMPMRELPKLPQARMYLKSDSWGFETLLSQQLSGYGFRFHIIGVLASLRAVQHALEAHDQTLSSEHRAVITKWWQENKDWRTIPELEFIKTSRDLILKKGAFESYASRHERSSGGKSSVIEYELAYYVDGKRRDLEADIRKSIAWCDKELTRIESKLPIRYEEDSVEENEWEFLGDGEEE